MAQLLDQNEMGLTIIDQAHQIRRLTEINDNMNVMLGQQNARIAELEKAAEAREVADQITASRPKEDKA